MTSTEPMTNKPGPELDQIVAEKVFGHKPDKHRPGLVKVGNNSSYPRQYSTSWEGMRLVVEEMQRRGWVFTLNLHGPRWEAIFGTEYNAFGDTAPHAVCMAAIRALAAIEGQET